MNYAKKNGPYFQRKTRKRLEAHKKYTNTNNSTTYINTTRRQTTHDDENKKERICVNVYSYENDK